MGDRIKVAIRMRPPIPSDNDIEENWIVKDRRYISSESREFEFDRVFTGKENNWVVYQELCEPIIDKVMQGFNGTIIAYGLTSSGKTYTMLGEHNGIVEGIIHYAMNDIFETIQLTPERIFLLRVAFLEIYNEKVYDMLYTDNDSNNEVTLKADAYGNINFQYSGGKGKKSSLKDRFVKNAEQIKTLIHEGLKNRRTGETAMNERSSRSHCIFRMIIESRLRDQDDENAEFFVSHLNLVDLAGSENASQNNAPNRYKEGCYINKSLSTLSQVIHKLSNDKTSKIKQFINFRDSNLTRILKNSLGGDSLTAIICTVTPASSRDNIYTLQFAECAKKVKNEPKKNEHLSEQALLRQYEHHIKKLSEELEASKEKGKELEEKTKQNENLKKEIEFLKSITVPLSNDKSNRRGTWCGYLQKPFPALPRNPRPKPSLSILEEECEGVLGFSDLDFDLTCKRKNSSNITTSAVLNSSPPRRFSDVETQTVIEVNSPDYNFGETYEEVVEIRVAELKSVILKLEKELSELNEYTTLEMQHIKADSELQKQLEALRDENDTLKKALESSTVLTEGAVSRSGIYSTNDHNQETEKNNSVNRKGTDERNMKSLNTELGSSCFQNSLVEVSNNSIIDVSGVSIDDSMKSHFLTLYDECLESETVSKLKTELESLKYENSLKDQKMNLLKEKLEIKDQMILSLKEEIVLVQTESIHTFKSDNSESNTPTNNLPDSNSRIRECLDKQTSPFKFVKDDNVDGTCQTSFVGSSTSTEECCTSLSKPELSCVHRICQTSFSIPIIDYKDSQTSPLKSLENDQSHAVCQTNFDSLTKDIKNSQTSPIRLENISYVHKICQTCCNTPVKNIKWCQTSPLKLDTAVYVQEACQTDCNTPVQSIKESQTSPLRLVFKGSDEVCQIGFNSPLERTEICEMIPIKSSHTSIKCYKCSSVTGSDAIDMSPVKLENLDSKAEQEIETLNEHIMTLEFNLKEKEEYTELLGNQLDLKNEEVASLSLKLSETKLSFDKMNDDFLTLTKRISNMKHSLSQLTFICEMLNDVESENEFTKLKALSEISPSSQYSIPSHDVTLIENLIVKLNSFMEENASKIINLSTKLKTVQNELFAIQKKNSKHASLENFSKCIQTEFIRGIDSTKTIENFENGELESQLKKDIKFLEEKNKELEKNYDELKNKMQSLEDCHSAEIFDLETKFQTAKSDWNIKMLQLIRDLEAKYEQELNDQDNKFTEDLHKKIQDMKQEHLKQIFKKEEDFKENIAKIKSSHSEELLQLQKQIKDIEEQLFTESIEKENLRHRLEKEKEQEIIIIRRKCEEVVDKFKEKLRQYKSDNSQLKYQLQHYVEEVTKLKKTNIVNKVEPVSEELEDKLNEMSSERDLLVKKYTLAKQHIAELKDELKKLKQLNDQVDLQYKLNSKEIEETKKELLFELDQKKAKIMSLESNNASMILELKKLKDMLSSKNTLNNKANTKGSKNDTPARSENWYEKKLEKSRECEVAQENQVVRKAVSEDEENQKENENPDGKNADDEKILCIGGGSGPANMVKNYWLEGVIHKKDKEIAKLKKELAHYKCEPKTYHPRVSSEKKAIAETHVKASEAPVSVSPLQEMDEHVTVHRAALQPYPEGAIPKVQAKQILKERNRRMSGKPYDQPPRTLHSKMQDRNSDRHHCMPTPKENNPTPKTTEEAVNILAEGNPECKQM